MATHSSVLAWRIPGTGKPGGLPSMGLHRIRHDWSDLAAVAAACVPGKGTTSRAESGLLSNIEMNYPRRPILLTKQEILLGRGTPLESSWVRGNQEDCSATWLTVSGFMVMGLVSRLSLANHSDSESFLEADALLNWDGCQWEGLWEVVGHTVSPFDLSQTLLVGGGLLVPCSLLGPPVIKQPMQMGTIVPGQGGQLQSVCLP